MWNIIPVAAAPLVFAWQAQHLGVLSVVCVAGGLSCFARFRRVPVAVAAGIAWQAQDFGVLSVVCVAGGLSCSLDRSLVFYG